MATTMTEEEILKIQWMFQYNPKAVYDIEDVIKQQLTEEWTMYWHRDLARAGQRIYFMRSGGDKAAITFIGRIASPIFEKESDDKFLHYWVDVTYDERVDPPITRAEMRDDIDDALKNYRPYVIGHFATNFLLPPDVARRSAELVRNRTRPIGPSAGARNLYAFISHSHEDGEFVERLAQDLQHALGGEDLAWYDRAPTGLKGGDEWWSEIRKQLDTRPVFIPVLSPAAMRSPWVNEEIDIAWPRRHSLSRRVRVIPVLYKDCGNLLRSDVGSIQYISFAEPSRYNAALNELVTRIKMTTTENQDMA